jgi:hypothetical protein
MAVRIWYDERVSKELNFNFRCGRLRIRFWDVVLFLKKGIPVELMHQDKTAPSMVSPSVRPTVAPNSWKGEMGPGKPANESGALGMPGQINSPEDISFNRSRFDQSLKQSHGLAFLAAQSSGSFASGNPIAHGTMAHMRQIFVSTEGDGVDVGAMDDATRRLYSEDLVRQTEEFGAYPGMDDPDSPVPPIRPLSYSFNPFAEKWVSPLGRESVIDVYDKIGRQLGLKPIFLPSEKVVVH